MPSARGSPAFLFLSSAGGRPPRAFRLPPSRSVLPGLIGRRYRGDEIVIGHGSELSRRDLFYINPSASSVSFFLLVLLRRRPPTPCSRLRLFAQLSRCSFSYSPVIRYLAADQNGRAPPVGIGRSRGNCDIKLQRFSMAHGNGWPASFGVVLWSIWNAPSFRGPRARSLGF